MQFISEGGGGGVKTFGCGLDHPLPNLISEFAPSINSKQINNYVPRKGSTKKTFSGKGTFLLCKRLI